MVNILRVRCPVDIALGIQRALVLSFIISSIHSTTLRGVYSLHLYTVYTSSKYHLHHNATLLYYYMQVNVKVYCNYVSSASGDTRMCTTCNVGDIVIMWERSTCV